MTKENEVSALKTKLRNCFISIRPWSFTASFVSILLGSVLAWKIENFFDFRLFFLTLTTVISTHAAGNLVNTLYDFKNGVDTKISDDKTLVKEILQTQEVRSLIHLCYELAIASFLVICLGFPQVSIKHCLPLFMAGILSSFVYTGSIGLKYIALGDVVVFTAFGPVITLFTYSVQTGQFSGLCIACALPLASLTEAILHSNNIRDLETDKKSGIVTMAILLGQSKACILYSCLVFIPYIMVMIMAILQSYWLFLPLLSLPLAAELNSECWHGNSKCNHDENMRHHDNNTYDQGNSKCNQGYTTCNHNNKCDCDDSKSYHDNDHCHGNFHNIPQKTAMLNLVFGVLYISGMLI